LETVKKLPLPGVTESAAATAALQMMLRITTLDDMDTYQHLWLLRSLLPYLLTRVKAKSAAEPLELLGMLQANPQVWEAYGMASYVPTQSVVRAAVRLIKGCGLTPELRAVAAAVRAEGEAHAMDADRRKAVALLAELLDTSAPEERLVEATDDWGVPAQAALQEMPAELRAKWVSLLEHASAANGSRPSAAWLREARKRIEALGADTARDQIERWLGLLAERGAGHAVGPISPFGEMRPGSMIPDRNSDLLRGLIWTCLIFDDEAMARTVGQAARECFRKIPDFGSRSTKAGNGCVYVLSQLTHREAVAQLHALQVNLKLPSIQKTVDAALKVASGRAGVTRADLEEMSVPAFDLVDGKRVWQLGDCRAELVVEGASVALRWWGPDEKSLRAEPAAVRRGFADEVKAIKQTEKQMAAALRTHRDRIEALYLQERTWPYAVWRERYLDHPLLGGMVRRLVWEIRSPDWTAVAWRNGTLVDAADQPVEEPPADAEVRLWHPVWAPADEVRAWRGWLSRHEVTQPFKQAHREIYLLTDAERTTVDYSNRFAAHVLRQHQLSALCQERGWRYRLQGDFDGWNAPTRPLPRQGLQAEFVVDAIEAGGPTSRMGLYLFVSTDQVRFVRSDLPVSVPLADVPPLVFSEVMRDVDLFVGVCSVGNDPTWAVDAPQPFHDYWESYAAGELSASAQSRRDVLEELLPRLKIASRCSLEDRYLVVRGDLRTYRIHLGSGNILMEPNNQYLCIVPARGGGIETSGSQLFLPFEGDGMLAIILSKAFLLADDRSITDPSITRQLE
jgi:hypothetical protein